MYLLRGFSQEAVDPPLGPIMKPRYSAEGTTEKLDHSGTILLIALEFFFAGPEWGQFLMVLGYIF